MSRLFLKFSSVLLVSLLILVAVPTPALAASELITNGGFETGNLSGWTAQHIFYNEDFTGIWCQSWQAVTTTPCVFEPVTPLQGSYMAYNSFDGDPQQLSMYQDVTIPASSTALFSFNYRVQWYNYNRGFTEARTMVVQVRDTSNHILETIHHFSTGNAVCCFIHEDTHWITVNADLSAYAGQTIRLFIFENVPQSYTGGAEMYFDNFSLQSFTGNVGEVKIAQSGGTTTADEGGTTDTFTFTLDHSPSSQVTINLTPDSQCTLDQNSVVLNNSNWNTGVMRTVTASDDAAIEGNHLCRVTTAAASSSDATFNTIDPPDVPVVIFDNDGTAPRLTNCPPSTATKNQAFSHTFTATGDPAPTFTQVGGSLPAGLTLNPTTGQLSGTPTQQSDGEVIATVSIENSAGAFDTPSFRMAVRNDSLAFPGFGFPSAGHNHFDNFQPLPGIVGEFFCFRFQNVGNPEPTYNLIGTLPAGLSWVGDTISGTPSVSGIAGPFTIEAVNSVGQQSQKFMLNIYPARALPAITSSAPPAANVGVPYSHTFTMTGGPTPQIGLNGAALPPGLTFTGNTISGTPTAAGNYGVISAVARNGSGRSAAQDFTLVVNNAQSAPHITSSNHPTGTLNVPFSFTFTASGNPAPAFNLSGASLPAGLSFSNGVISGTPTAVGTSGTITVTANNNVTPTDTQNITITINSAAPTITSATPPQPKVGEVYTHTFTATGNPAPTFSLGGDNLPQGLSWDGATATISGIPTTIVTTGSISVTASNSAGSDTDFFNLSVAGTAPEITSALPPAGTVGVSYSHTFTADGVPAPTFALSGAALPAGLSWNGTDTISGIPTGNGGVSGTITVTASNGTNPDDTQNFTITVNAEPQITSGTPPDAKVTASYTHTFTATGYPAPTFSISGATLPPGLSWNGTDTITGIPTGNGGVSGSITVTATNGIGSDATQNFTITVNAAPHISSNVPSAGTLDVDYRHTFTATGYPTPTLSLSGASLPDGLSFVNGVISGKPTSTGTTGTITLTASNGINPDATQNFTITINGAAPVITSQLPPAGKVGDAYSHTFTATGKPTPTFALSGASLPDGLSFANGVISGTPTAAALGTTATITVTATNGVNPDATQDFTITVNGIPPQITSAPPPSGSVGTSYAFTITASGTPAPTITLAGALPAGLTFNNGVISGVPQLGGTTGTITVTASNGFAPNGTQNFTISIASLANAVPVLNYYTTATPTLHWNPVTGASVTYEVEVYDNAGLTGNPVYEYSGAANQTTITPALPDNTYYWRVRANTPTRTGTWSKTEKIVVNG